MKCIVLTFAHYISIHSLRMEGDRSRANFFSWSFTFQSTPSAWRETVRTGKHIIKACISIHSLRMEGDSAVTCANCATGTFQSTPSAWRETRLIATGGTVKVFQSTPSAWRETLPPAERGLLCLISIHSLRMEGDVFSVGVCARCKYFNPLPPHGGRLFHSEMI